MRLTGHTPLSKISAEKISVQQKTILSALWVESVEEFTAMMAAMEEAEETTDRSILMTLKKSESTLLEEFPEEVLAPWRQAYAAGSLGCLVDPEILKTFREQGRISSPGSVISQLSDKPLPPRVQLMDKLFPIRDQGHRGTCVAFSSAALREYLEECSTELSEQFLYWACKNLDGYPDEAGTFIHSAMSALSTLGVCPREIWPYNPKSIQGNESQSPPPDGAKQAALDFIMSYTRTVASNCVNHYKQILSGADGLGGMPVVIASLVFNSWFRSAATRQTGKITMPLPGEQPLTGGHAMLIVGYQDDTSVPGGGYFIVRNSWGTTWAVVSPEAPGHALMPYAYVERYIVDAFSGQLLSGKTDAPEDKNAITKSKTETATKTRNSFEETYIYTLRRDARDIEGKLLRAGTRVIRHPDAPEEFLEDTPANRRIFKEKHFAWSDFVSQAAWFPSPDKWSESLEAGMSRSMSLCQEFVAAIDKNIISSVGHSIPDVNLSPMLYALAWMPKIRKVEPVADLSDTFIESIGRNGHLPENIVPPQEWFNVLYSCNSFKIYSVRSRFGSFYVVSAFVTPLLFSQSGEIGFTQAGPAISEIVQSLYAKWYNKQQNAKFTFYTIGSSQQWKEGTKGVVSSKDLTILSAPNGEERWDSISPPQFAAGLYLRNFLDRLRPETSQQRILHIKKAVDKYIQSGYEGNILLDKIARETGYRRTSVKESFKAMQESKHYECYKVGGKLAVRTVSGRKPRMIRIEIESSFVRYHFGMILGAFISVFFWRLGDVLGAERLGLTNVLIAILLVYAGKCIEVIVRRKMTE